MFRIATRTGNPGGKHSSPGRQGGTSPVLSCLSPPPAKDPEHDCQICCLFDHIDRRAFRLDVAEFCTVKQSDEITGIAPCSDASLKLAGPRLGSVFFGADLLCVLTAARNAGRLFFVRGRGWLQAASALRMKSSTDCGLRPTSVSKSSLTVS